MKTLFRIFNVMFFSAALVFAGFSSVFAVPPTTPPNSTVDWCALCPDGGMWNPNINQCEKCIDGDYNADTCTCQCKPDNEYIPSIGCRKSWEWCEFDCEKYNGTWDPLTHSCSGTIKCYGEDQVYDPNTCECICVKGGVFNPTTHQCEPDPKLCNGRCTAPNFWNDDTGHCETCVSVPGVSYYDPGTCQCRCTQEGYEYDAATGTCVPDGGGSGQTCQAGYYWEPGKQTCQPCDQGYYNDTPGAASCTKCPDGRTTSDVGATTCDKICDNADHVASWVATGVCQISTCQVGYTKSGNSCVANTYTINYNLNGGSYGSSHPTSGTYNLPFTVSNPTRTGYTFSGWQITGMDSVTHTYGSATTTSTSISSTKATTFMNLRATSGTVTFTANWTPSTYTVSFNANGGTGGQTANVTATYGQAMPAISTTAPTRTGYTFAGWYDNATSGTKYYNADGTSARNWDKTANTTLYAQWIENIGVYTIYIDYRRKRIIGGSSYDDMVYAYNGNYYSDSAHTQQISAIMPASSPSLFCSFAGFYDSIGGNQFVNTNGQFTSYALSHVPTQDTYLYARYTCNGSPARVLGYDYNCAGDVNNGLWYEYGPTSDFDVSNITDLSGVTSTASSCGEFSGWCAHQTYYVAPGEMYDIDAGYTSNIEAKWCRTTGLHPNLVAWGPSPAELISMGYTNNETSARLALCQNNIGAVKCDAGYKMQASSDGHIVGEYILDNELVRLWDNCTEAGLITSCTACTNTIPAHSHYSASAPTINGNCPWECDSGYVLSNNQCVSQNACYTVTLNNTTNGGTGGTTVLYKKLNDTKWYSDSNCTTQVTTLTKPTKTNATYGGHYTSSSDGTQYVTNNGTLSTTWTVAENKTLYAQYDCNENYRQAGTRISGTCAANEHTVSFNANGGTGGQTANVTATYGAAMPAISTTAPTRTGYTFAGWYDSVSLPSGYKKLEYIAKNNASQYIQTDYVGNLNSRYEGAVLLTNNTDAYDIASRVNASGNTRNIAFACSGSTSYIGYGTYTSAATNRHQCVLNDRMDFVTDYLNRQWSVSIGNSTSTKQMSSDAITSFTNTAPLQIFFNRVAGATSAASYAAPIGTRIYYLKIYENNNLVHHFVPAKRSSDNAIGVYDVVENEFLTNAIANTGSFTAGPETNLEVKYYNANGTSAKNWDKTANTTLYARWTAKTYTVSFNANGGTGGQTADVTATYGAAMPAISTTAPTRTGYTFDGWYDNATSGTKYYNADGTSAKNWDKNANTTLYARWDGIKYTITLDDEANGGTSGSGSVIQKYASRWTTNDDAQTTITNVNIPKRTNSIFNGYYSAKTNGTQHIPATGVLPSNTTFTDDTTLYAQFSSCQCSAGTGVDTCTTSSTTSNTCTATATCKVGYEEPVASCTGANCTSSCTPQKYTISIKPNGGKINGSVNDFEFYELYDTEFRDLTGNNVLTDIPVAVRDGYSLTGYFTASTGGTLKIGSDGLLPVPSTFMGDTTLYAQWAQDVITCAAGNYLPANSTTCATCPAGYSCAGGSASPVMCGTNKYSTGGAASCSSCTNGLTTSSVADARYHDEAADCGRVLHIGAYEIRLKSIPSTGSLSSLVPSPALRFNYARNANGRPDFYANMSTIASPMRVTATGAISTAGSGDKFKTRYNNTNYYVCDDVTCVTQ